MIDSHLIHTIFFDLDDTLYPRSSGLWPALGERIETYMHEKLSLAREEIPSLRRRLFHTYGTTLRGLQQCYHVDARDFLAYVHDVPLEKFIHPRRGLRDLISAYPQRKIIFTNADSKHAGRVISRLGLNGCFHQVIDILDISPYCKPMAEAFEIALRLAGSPDPDSCLLVDDNPANIKAARGFGFQIVCVGRPEMDAEIEPSKFIPDLIDLPSVFPIDGNGKI